MRSSEKNLSQKYMGDKHCPVVQQKSTQNFKQFSSKLKKNTKLKKIKQKTNKKNHTGMFSKEHLFSINHGVVILWLLINQTLGVLISCKSIF